MTKERLEQIKENVNRRNIINAVCGIKTNDADNEILELLAYIEELENGHNSKS